MALATYDDIKGGVANWLFDRPDLAPMAPDFVTLFESDMNRIARTRHQLTTAILTPDADGVADIPADYLEFRQVTALTNPRRNLSLVTPSYMNEKVPYPTSNCPAFFTIDGNTITVKPYTTSDIEFIYWAKIPALADDMPSNWLLQAYPNLYLFGACKYAALYIGDQERIASMGNIFNGQLAAFLEDQKRASYARASMRASGPTP